MCSMRVNLKILAIVLMIGLASACVTMQPLKGNLSKEEIANTIRWGDEIKIVTKTGDQHLDKFAYVTEDKIIGYEKEFQLENIERIEIKKITAAGEAGLVVGAVGVAYLMYVIFAAITLAIIGL